MKLHIEIDEEELKQLVVDRINRTLPDEIEMLNVTDIKFLVKSKNNFREQEWEQGRLFVTVDKDV